jgi:predicted secreted protein
MSNKENLKIKRVMEKLKDERSKKVIFVAHCILNENTRWLGGAYRSGCIDEIVDQLQDRGIGIVQMKCPEQQAMGGVVKTSEWRMLGEKDSLLYKLRGVGLPFFFWNVRRIYRKIAKEVVRDVKDYKEHGFEVVGIVGSAGSPSCGVNTTYDDMMGLTDILANTDIEDLDRENLNKKIIGLCKKGKGLFVKALEEELQKNNLTVKFFEQDCLAEMRGERTPIALDDE